MSLFDKNDRYTEKAGEIDREIALALEPIFTKYENLSLREIGYIAFAVVQELVCVHVLDKEKNKQC